MVKQLKKRRSFHFVKGISIAVSIIVCLYLLIGFMTTAKPSSRLSSVIFTDWTSNMNYSVFSLLYSFENKAYAIHHRNLLDQFSLSDVMIQFITNIQFDDLKSFIGKELPGFSTYERNFIIATHDINESDILSHESGPPIEQILEERDAIVEEKEEKEGQGEITQTPSTEKKVVFLYNSHNRESFLPHLPKETTSNGAYHEEVNITKVSKDLAKKLERYGIGTTVDKTDITKVLHKNGWKYGSSYKASRPVVETALANNKELQYVFDIHRDSLPYKQTTTYINDQAYAMILFVIGAENKKYEKNLKLATELHYLIEEKYPGLSKGVVTKEGPNSNGIYNQDLLENALLMEVGGYDNHLEELYRTISVFAEIFQSYYWDAEQVNKQSEQ